MALDPGSLTVTTREALAQLRDPSGFQWTIVYMVILTAYLYANEVQAKRWNVVAAGLALWFADWINEIVNSGILAWTGIAPLWVETGRTSFQVLVGVNIETNLLFLLHGMVYAKMLPQDRNQKMFGINNRMAVALGMSLFSVLIEIVLNRIDVLRWHWTFWDVPLGLPFIFVFGYLWFFLAA
ncbi:MAG: hypothetical protein HY899_08260, partial [Deltaproteobacteria bacterium]|nr:hypothetical protein [Deltaproteobacteria bacterium]